MQVISATNPTEWTSRLTGGTAVLLASLTGLIAVSISPREIPDKEGTARVEPPTVAVIEREQSDVGGVIAFCARHTTNDRGFVVFQNGTCVIVPEPSADPVSTAKQLLMEAALPEAKFLSERTAEGDLIVTFGGPVFHWIPADQLDGLDLWAEKNLNKLFSEDEKLVAKEGWMPPVDARLGLVARFRLLDDGRAPKLVRVIRPLPETAAR